MIPPPTQSDVAFDAQLCGMKRRRHCTNGDLKLSVPHSLLPRQMECRGEPDKENDCSPVTKKMRPALSTIKTPEAAKAVFDNHLRRQHEARIAEDALKIYRHTCRKRFVEACVVRSKQPMAKCTSPSSIATDLLVSNCGSCGKKTCLTCCLNYAIVMRSTKATGRLHECRKQRIKQRVNDLYKSGTEAAQTKMSEIYDQAKKLSFKLERALPTIIEEGAATISERGTATISCTMKRRVALPCTANKLYNIVSGLYNNNLSFRDETNEWLSEKRLKNGSSCVADLCSGHYSARNYREYQVRLCKNVFVEENGCKLKHCGTCRHLVPKSSFLPGTGPMAVCYTAILDADARHMDVRRELSQTPLQQTCEPCKVRRKALIDRKPAA